MRTVEWHPTYQAWCVVQWMDVGFLTRKGKDIASLKSKDKVDAECEAMLLGYL